MEEYTLKRYTVNDKLDIENMINDFKGYIYTIIENNARNRLSNEDKEEIMSDVFLTVWHNKEKIDTNRPLKYYMAGIAKNLISNKLRNHKKYNNQNEFKDIEISDLEDIEIVCEQNQALEVISKELNNMKAIDYKIFAEYYYYSKSMKEIAEELGISEGNVGVRLHRIRRKLRKNLEKRGFTYKKILSVILVLFLLTGVVFAKQIVNYVKQIVGKEEITEQIELENPVIDMAVENEVIKNYMQKYDDRTYLLTINDIETFNEAKNTLGIEFKANYGSEYINKDVFEKYKYDVILLYIEDEKAWYVNSVVPYEVKTMITLITSKTPSTIGKKQVYCILIPREDNNENIEIKYSEREEPPEGATFFMPCYVKNIQEFDELNLKKSEDGELYCTDFLDIQEYRELAEKLKLETAKDIDEYGKNREVAIIFKKTDKKVRLDRIREEENGLRIELSEMDENYGEGIAGMIISIKKEKYVTYEVYWK